MDRADGNGLKSVATRSAEPGALKHFYSDGFQNYRYS